MEASVAENDVDKHSSNLKVCIDQQASSVKCLLIMEQR